MADFFNVTRVVVPFADGYCRSNRRHEVPSMQSVYDYMDFLVALPPNQREGHVHRMMWSRPRLAAEVVYRMGNRYHAHTVALARWEQRVEGWAADVHNRVRLNIQAGVAIPCDRAGNLWPAEGAPPRPVPPPAQN